MTTVKLNVPHIHAGKNLPENTPFEVDAPELNWLKKNLKDSLVIVNEKDTPTGKAADAPTPEKGDK